MPPPLISRRLARETWDDWGVVSGWLAEDLRAGRLGLVLGAGASVGFGLPDWEILLATAFKQIGAPIKSFKAKQGLPKQARLLLEVYCGNDQLYFASLLRKALYEGFPQEDLGLDTFLKNPLLPAICSLITASERGHITEIISYNFDDLVEEYLRMQGLRVRSKSTLPEWAAKLDVEVFHPHGLLSVRDEIIRDGVVAFPEQFEIYHKDRSPLIDAKLLEILSSHTVLFVGVSGVDPRLQDLLLTINDYHPAVRANQPYWGVRFSNDPLDPLKSTWEDSGVVQCTVDYDELPTRIFEICRKAAAAS